MPLSMTGFGEAHRQQDGLAVTVEVRTINSRYFKLSLRITEGYASLEPQIESVVRERIRRGTIQVSVWVERVHTPDDYRINTAVLAGYRQQLEALARDWRLDGPISLENLLLLPGVIDEQTNRSIHADTDWPLIHEALQAAIEHMDRMRAEEGRAMAADLAANCRVIASCLEVVAERAPRVVEGYRARLEERLSKTLAEFGVTLDPSDLIKEVSLFAERSDISEEIVRLRSHLEQFGSFLDGPESSGRKLEFLTQEMLREVNTIGSKANDVEIARQVIEIKSSLERIREMIQNIE
ncbi:MAG: YicC family protein [Thermoguttaceae bacterium]|nr:YicC family protein [Thermoguttaceae bacterium]